ncbi:hypothetical protein QZH41_000282 [Actinostola sp. cb2023]|nr:hypothetical protein QZH41_000282 [Actinostola sp. cb2023]
MKLCLIWGVLAVLVVPGLSMDATLETDEIPALLKLLNDVSEEHDIPSLLMLPNDVSGEAKRDGGDVLHHLHCLELHKAGYCKYGLIKNKFCKKTCFLCNIEPLGMQSRAIPDARITASSMWDGNHAPAQGRLNYKPPRGKAGSWSSRHNRVGQWIQVDLKRVTKVAGIATQGRSNANQWVKQYKLQYSSDGKTFNNYEGGKVFAANKDRNSVVKHNLYKPIVARLPIMESELVDPGWMKFNCKSGELLFYYNKDTAEHKFPMWNSISREYCMGETIDGSRHNADPRSMDYPDPWTTPTHGPPHGLPQGPPHGIDHGAPHGKPIGPPHGPPHRLPHGPPHRLPHGPPHGYPMDHPIDYPMDHPMD